VIAAAHSGIRVLGISCVTNMAAGILDQPITTEEVIETGERVKADFVALLRAILPQLHGDVRKDKDTRVSKDTRTSKSTRLPKDSRLSKDRS
jgi:hypothetical protein